MATIAIARALFPFQGTEASDLSFQADEIIRILKKDESGWWEGQTDDGRRGDFPYNYVEQIDPSEVERIRAVSRAMTAPKAFSPAQIANDSVLSVKVQPVPESYMFAVEARTSKGVLASQKSSEDFRTLDEHLRYIFPNFDKPLPPVWADKVYESNEASKKKARVLQIYLQKLIGNGNDTTEYAMVSWLDPSAQFAVSTEAKNTVREAQQVSAKNGGGRNSYNVAMVNAFPLAKAEFDWVPKDAVELPVAKGCIVAVRNQNTSSPGWWEGEISDGQRGLFPANYVKMLSQNEAKYIVLGKAPSSSGPVAVPAPKMDVAPANLGSNAVPKLVTQIKASKRQRKTESNFAMPSLEAFDDLLQDGFAMLVGNKTFSPRGASRKPQSGERVTMNYTGYVWDCQKQRILEFAASDLPDQNNYVGPLEFTIGRNETIKGLEQAAMNLEVGQECRIVIRPDLGFGEVGNPPAVPPNCHLVYDVKLEGFQGAAIPGPPSMATSQPLGLGFNNFRPTDAPVPVGGAQTLADVFASAQTKGQAFQSNAPIGARPKKPQQAPKKKIPKAQGGQKARSPEPEQPEVKYTLSKMKEIVGNKAYQEYGVNPAFLEDSLDEAAFQDAFSCTRAQFLLMPRWKQNNLKKEAGLY